MRPEASLGGLASPFVLHHILHNSRRKEYHWWKILLGPSPPKEGLARACGSHLYVACWSVCDQNQDFWSAKTVLVVLFWSSWLLDFKQVKGQFAAMCSSRSQSQTQNQPQCGSLSVYWKRYARRMRSGDETTMCSWSSVQRLLSSLDRLSKKGFDRSIQFWSWSQTLLHKTYKWLPLVGESHKLHIQPPDHF